MASSRSSASSSNDELIKFVPFSHTASTTADTYCCCFSPDSSILATSGGGPSHDFIIRLWNVGSKTCVHELVGHSDDVNALVSFASADDGKPRLASASFDGTIRIWSLDEELGYPLLHTIISSHSSSSIGINALSFDPIRRVLISGSCGDCTIKFWKENDDGVSWTFLVSKVCRSEIYALSISKDGQYLASGLDDGYILIWDLETRTIIRSWTTDSKWITQNGLHFSPTHSNHLLVCTEYGIMRIINVLTGAQIGSSMAVPRGVLLLPCLFTSDGRYILSANSHQKLTIWDADTQTIVQVLEESPGASPCSISAICMPPNGQYIACGYHDYPNVDSVIPFHVWEIL